jgi:hypothetical protein
MEMENTLAYYDTAKIIAVKCFIVQTGGRMFMGKARAYPGVEQLNGALLR